ncbi:hypothetical protein J6590_062933 [Homalodisca vitripennis]|nr:hypothetical protein J6590_062933 [Homalodisca vitripennis]
MDSTLECALKTQVNPGVCAENTSQPWSVRSKHKSTLECAPKTQVNPGVCAKNTSQPWSVRSKHKSILECAPKTQVNPGVCARNTTNPGLTTRLLDTATFCQSKYLIVTARGIIILRKIRICIHRT